MCVCALCPPRYRLQRWGTPLGRRGEAWLAKNPQTFPGNFPPPPPLQPSFPPPPLQPSFPPPPAWQPPQGSPANFPNAWGLTQCTRPPPPVDGVRGMGITIRPPAAAPFSLQLQNPSWNTPSQIFGNRTHEMPQAAMQCMSTIMDQIVGLRNAVDIAIAPS